MVNNEHSDQIFFGIMLDNSEIDENKIIDEVERLLRKQFNPNSLSPRVTK